MSSRTKIFLPLAILAVAGLSSYTLVLLRPEPESKERSVSPTTVEVVAAIRQTVTLTVKSQGTVAPRTETVLISQVSGMITQISDSLYSGGFFEKGEVLVKIDPSDYEAAAIRAQATLAQARLNLATEVAQAQQGGGGTLPRLGNAAIPPMPPHRLAAWRFWP